MLSTLRAAMDSAKHTWRSRASGSSSVAGGDAAGPAVTSMPPMVARDGRSVKFPTISALSIIARIAMEGAGGTGRAGQEWVVPDWAGRTGGKDWAGKTGRG